jgi:hypothetical protein
VPRASLTDSPKTDCSSRRSGNVGKRLGRK